MTTYKKTPFLGNASQQPFLLETTTDEDCSVYTEYTPSCASSTPEKFEMDSFDIDEEASMVSSPRDVFLTVLEQKLLEKQRSRKQQALTSPVQLRRSPSKNKLAPWLTPQKKKKKPLDRISGSKSRSSALMSKLKKPKRNHFRNYVLLLKPAKRTFELIEIRYETATSTIGDLIRMIPQRATVPDLASQTYVGLVRPKDGVEFTSLDKEATPTYVEGNGGTPMSIGHHDVLVAITKGYSGAQMAQCSKPILSNRQMVKLIAKSEKYSSSSSKRHHKKSGDSSKKTPEKANTKSSTPQSKTATPLKTPDSQTGTKTSSSSTSKEDSPRIHIKIPVPASSPCAGPNQEDMSKRSSPSDIHSPREWSPVHVEKGNEVVPPLTLTLSSRDEYSVSSTVSSGSFYTDHLLTTQYHVLPTTSKKCTRRAKRAKRKSLFSKFILAVLVFMVAIYRIRHFSLEPNVSATTPMGFEGLRQVLVLFMGLVLMQKHVVQASSKSAKTHRPMSFLMNFTT